MTNEETERAHESSEHMVGDMQDESCHSGEINVLAFLRAIWLRKVWIVASISLGTIVAIAYALFATDWYCAETVLLPRDGGSSVGISGQLAQLGGLASLAGISMGQASKQEPLGVLRSVGFARRFVEQNDVMSVLSKEIGQVPPGAGDAPDRNVQRVVDYFRKSIFTILEDKKTGLITVAIEWKDPALAAKWANAIPKQLNEEMRQRALDEASRNVQYLRDQLARTEAISLQQAIARLIETEMQKLMLAEGTAQYALRVIDDAQPPSKRSRPNRKILVLAAFVGSLCASVLIVILLDPWKLLLQKVRMAE